MGYDDPVTARAFQAARSLPPEALGDWRAALAAYLPPPSGLPVLDLGSGTGAFSGLLADWFGAWVAALEPAAAMRAQARARAHPRVALAGGEAERLPLKTASCGAAWLSSVVHHFRDLPRSAAELRRVLAPGAPVLIRGAFPGRLRHLTLFRYFPAAATVAERFPTVAAVIAAFEGAGFALESLEQVAQVTAPSLRELERLSRLRADTTLAALDEEELAAGDAALAADAAAERVPAPVIDRLDLLVLR